MKNKTQKDSKLLEQRAKNYPNLSSVHLLHPELIGVSWCSNCKTGLTTDSRKQYCNKCMSRLEAMLQNEYGIKVDTKYAQTHPLYQVEAMLQEEAYNLWEGRK